MTHTATLLLNLLKINQEIETNLKHQEIITEDNDLNNMVRIASDALNFLTTALCQRVLDEEFDVTINAELPIAAEHYKNSCEDGATNNTNP